MMQQWITDQIHRARSGHVSVPHRFREGPMNYETERDILVETPEEAYCIIAHGRRAGNIGRQVRKVEALRDAGIVPIPVFDRDAWDFYRAGNARAREERGITSHGGDAVDIFGLEQRMAAMQDDSLLYFTRQGMPHLERVRFKDRPIVGRYDASTSHTLPEHKQVAHRLVRARLVDDVQAIYPHNGLVCERVSEEPLYGTLQTYHRQRRQQPTLFSQDPRLMGH